ncbi:MAG: hypothetical protein A3E87_02210 [Gammaproteobacteria bacterium RIFCSPHIGHO2_12_FULL_35_23]|nr:MAG: hypothetical protein A3E87_02210 [Gammaproteobacteria bacterium RIFCSPHIGHO2_12_FULL_35_23]
MRLISLLIILLIIPMFSQAAQRAHMRGERYCEIILAKSLTKYAVYSTVGLNDCPEKIWHNITVTEVKKETHSSFVHLNGPRYWVIDGLENSNLINPTIKTINGLAMREAGILNISLFDLLFNKPYQKREVERHTTWSYQTGKPIYELIDPKNNVYVMQSYSIQKYFQTEDSLSKLGSKLHLPTGWSFKTGVLKQSETIQAVNNLAIVIQDDFLNTYQKATHDFLKEDYKFSNLYTST